MRRLIHQIRERLPQRERGAVLILGAAVMTVLIGMAGFAIDFGWLYWNGIKIQHGADAAALAGVIYEPDDQTNAFLHATRSASENGYSVSSGASVVPADSVSSPGSVDNPQQLRVTITAPIQTFFMRVFSINSIDVRKTAVAEYVLPLPLGSPDNKFGNDPSIGHEPNFWGNIHGYYTGRGMGDRYASQCTSWNAGSGCAKNPDRRETASYDWSSTTPGTTSAVSGGYVYGVEVNSAGTVNVQVFDGQFTRGGGDQILVGDNPQGGGPGPTTVFILYDADPTPLDTSDNTVLCRVEFGPRDSLMPSATATTTFAEYDAYLQANPVNDPKGLINELDDLWDPICSRNLTPGIYPLRVLVLDNGERGLNRWSLKATGASARLFGLGDMSIYSNVNGATGDTVFYLAEVDPIHAGKDLVISLWDPGDASGNHSMRVRPPGGGTPPPCSWTSTNSSYPGGTLGSCDIPTSDSRFNDHLVEIRIDIPDSYTCAADCWWKIDYNYVGQTQDTTTWSARIEGNPVKLVE